MEKEKIINSLNMIADLLEIKGENAFKCKAYRSGAHALEVYEDSFDELVASGNISELKGIGKGLAEKITDLYNTGSTHILDELKTELPEGLLDMLNIPGFGPKKTKIVYDNLGIKSIMELECACIENKLVDLPGFGEKTQDKILNGIELFKRSKGKFLVSTAHNTAASIINEIKKVPGVQRIEVAGSLRRYKETVKDIDILVSSDNPAPIMEKFTTLSGIFQITGKGETKSSVVFESGIAADLRVVSDEQFASALNYFTGSKEHNILLRSRAIKRDMKLSEYGLFKTGGGDEAIIPCASEEEIYKLLELSYIPPELREASGEIEAAEKNALPSLVEASDIKGIFHVHTIYSDGLMTLEEIVHKMISMGMKYVGISDHSQSAHYANGLTSHDIKLQWAEIDHLNQKYPGFKIFKGIESDILKDGRLDYSDAILKGFDFIIGSVHSNFNMGEEEMTERVITALKNPFLTMLGHPTGRLLLARESYKIDMDKIIDAARENNKIIEINCNPHRLDLDWRYCRKAAANSVLLSINPDAHRLEGLEDIKYGAGIARKGWCGADDIFNTRTAQDAAEYFTKKR